MPDPSSIAPVEPASSLLDLIIQTAPDAIITVDADGIIVSFSPRAEQMFGYSRQEVVGRNINCLMPEPFRSQHDGYMARYMETGEKRIIGIGREVRAMRKNGEVFPAELAVGELHSGAQRVFTGFIRDITDRVHAQRRAERLQHNLDQVARIQMLGEMATALAHEINQPLSAISNFARASSRALQAENPDLARVATYMDNVADQAQRAGQIIKRMRRLVDRGQVDLKIEDINDIVREAVHFSQHGANEPGVSVVLDLTKPLPPVRADRIQVQQVLVNLLRNASDAIAGDGRHDVVVSTALSEPLGTIRLSADHREGEVIVSISDTGEGLPDSLVETLFEPFTTTKQTGLGVGLAVSKSIIQAHGGRIWAENGPDGGAEFHFTLPVADAT